MIDGGVNLELSSRAIEEEDFSEVSSGAGVKVMCSLGRLVLPNIIPSNVCSPVEIIPP